MTDSAGIAVGTVSMQGDLRGTGNKRRYAGNTYNKELSGLSGFGIGIAYCVLPPGKRGQIK
jgi:hypothetical protein